MIPKTSTTESVEEAQQHQHQQNNKDLKHKHWPSTTTYESRAVRNRRSVSNLTPNANSSSNVNVNITGTKKSSRFNNSKTHGQGHDLNDNQGEDDVFGVGVNDHPTPQTQTPPKTTQQEPPQPPHPLPPLQPQNYTTNYYGLHHGSIGVLSSSTVLRPFSKKQLTASSSSSSSSSRRKKDKTKTVPKDGSSSGLFTDFGRAMITIAKSNERKEARTSKVETTNYTMPAYVKFDHTYVNAKKELDLELDLAQEEEENDVALDLDYLLYRDEMLIELDQRANDETLTPIPTPTPFLLSPIPTPTPFLMNDELLSPITTNMDKYRQSSVQTQFEKSSQTQVETLNDDEDETLGIPNPEKYDVWKTHNSLPVRVRSSLSRSNVNSKGGNGSEGVLNENENEEYYRKELSESDAVFEVNTNTNTLALAHSQSSKSKPVSQSNKPLKYIIPSSPLGWKLTTPNRQRYIIATSALAKLKANERLPVTDKLSDLATALGLSDRVSRMLKDGGRRINGVAPSMNNQDVRTINNIRARQSMEADKQMSRSQSLKSAGGVRWRGKGSHGFNIKKLGFDEIDGGSVGRTFAGTIAGTSVTGGDSGGSGSGGGEKYGFDVVNGLDSGDYGDDLSVLRRDEILIREVYQTKES